LSKIECKIIFRNFFPKKNLETEDYMIFNNRGKYVPFFQVREPNFSYAMSFFQIQFISHPQPIKKQDILVHIGLIYATLYQNSNRT
jgi:hypothetical protein